MKHLTKTLLVVLLVVFLMLSVVNIFITNKITLESLSATKTRNEIAKLQEQNAILSSEILGYTSFEVISSKAASLGFHEEKDFISLYAPLQVAIGK